MIFLSSGGILSAILAIDNNLNSVVLEWAEESVVFSRSVILILFFGDLASRFFPPHDRFALVGDLFL